MSVLFAEINTEIWLSIGALSPDHPQFCEGTALVALFEYMLAIPKLQVNIVSKNIDTANLTSECKVFKNLILEYCKSKELNNIGDIYRYF